MENLPTITISEKVVLYHKFRIIISDNAIGIIETLRNKISDPFFATQPIGIGSGTDLGLSISYQIIVEKY